jgi:hypothetical protein
VIAIETKELPAKAVTKMKNLYIFLERKVGISSICTATDCVPIITKSAELGLSNTRSITPKVGQGFEDERTYREKDCI